MVIILRRSSICIHCITRYCRISWFSISYRVCVCVISIDISVSNTISRSVSIISRISRISICYRTVCIVCIIISTYRIFYIISNCIGI